MIGHAHKQALLLDDFEEQSLDRLDFLLTSIESGIRGQDILISEDVIEFTTYLSSENTQFFETAIQSFIDKFENKFETISKIGQLHRPHIGDLLIDSLSDLVVTFCEQMNRNYMTNNQLLEERCLSIIKLISITSRVCVLRHGFTRLFQMYNWSLSVSMNKGICFPHIRIDSFN